MKKLIMLFITFITLIGCGSGHQQEENTSEWGDSIATINNTSYYWLQLADDSAKMYMYKKRIERWKKIIWQPHGMGTN